MDITIFFMATPGELGSNSGVNQRTRRTGILIGIAGRGHSAKMENRAARYAVTGIRDSCGFRTSL
jgi:hypothetical protein